MKLSRFNIVVPNFPIEGEFLVFNTLSRAAIVINKDLEELRGEVDREYQYLNDLKSLGIMVKEEIDEDEVLVHLFNTVRYSTQILHVTILTTSSCNLACTYCVQEGVKNNKPMSEEVGKEVARWLARKMEAIHPQILSLVFYGGEPLLNPEAISFLSKSLKEEAKVRKVNFEYVIITNGTLLKSDLLREWEGGGLKYICVTLDGDRRAHNSKRPYKNGQGTFADIIQGLFRLKETKNIKANITVNLDRENIESIPYLLDYLQDRGLNGVINQIKFKPILRTINMANKLANPCQTCSFSDTNLDGLIWTRREARKRGFNIDTEVAIGPCKFYYENAVVIDSMGKLYNCDAFVGREEFSIGNIGDEDYNYRHREFMALGIDQECRECPYFPICAGGCKYSAYVKYGDYRRTTCERPYFEKVGKELLKLRYGR